MKIVKFDMSFWIHYLACTQIEQFIECEMLEDHFFFVLNVLEDQIAHAGIVTLPPFRGDLEENLGWSIPASAETRSLYILGPNLFSRC